MDAYPYRNLVGMLNYLKVRVDVVWIVRELQRHLGDYGLAMIEALERVIRYLRSTRDRVMTFRADYPAGLPAIFTMSDAAFADCQRTRGTHYGVVVSVFGCPVVTQAKMFKTRPLSTAEAEFMAAFEGHKLAKWVAMLAQECGVTVGWPLRQLVDNMAM